MDEPIVVMNFSDVYEKETFYKETEYQWLNCDDIEETNCYISEESEKEIKRRMQGKSPYAIHFIDSGNYHYLTKLWLEQIKEPCVLMVFDHHPDMQPPLFGDFTSCGSWVKNVLDTNHSVKQVVLVGVASTLTKSIEEKYRNRIILFPKEELQHKEAFKKLVEEQIHLPVYVSIDKDVLSTKEVLTNWNQGEMSIALLEELLDFVIEQEIVLGIDIAGESDLMEDASGNNEVNEELLHFIATTLDKNCDT